MGKIGNCFNKTYSPTQKGGGRINITPDHTEIEACGEKQDSAEELGMFLGRHGRRKRKSIGGGGSWWIQQQWHTLNHIPHFKSSWLIFLLIQMPLAIPIPVMSRCRITKCRSRGHNWRGHSQPAQASESLKKVISSFQLSITSSENGPFVPCHEWVYTDLRQRWCWFKSECTWNVDRGWKVGISGYQWCCFLLYYPLTCLCADLFCTGASSLTAGAQLFTACGGNPAVLNSMLPLETVKHTTLPEHVQGGEGTGCPWVRNVNFQVKIQSFSWRKPPLATTGL